VRAPIPTWTFVLAVVRQGDRFLLVHERKHGSGWYLPAGRVEPGESLTAAVHRETLEEAGIRIVLRGVLRIERQAYHDGAWMRVLFLAEPADDSPPKSQPDDESLGAAWYTPAEASRLTLRGELEVLSILDAARTPGCPVMPLSMLHDDGG